MDTNNSFADKLMTKLKPLYKRLISDVSHIKGEKDTFAVQWGKDFPIEYDRGILFVGKATNSWWTTEKNVDILFGPPNDEHTIFNRSDQMIWVEKQANPQSHYNTNKSAFWRVIRAVAQYYYPKDELNHIAWSNVCKIQFDEGDNPDGDLFDCQINTCKEIFKTELDVLSPKFVIMFTSGYGENELLSFINGGDMPKVVDVSNWDSYSVKVYKIGAIVFICTVHPMCKAEQPHAKCLIELINKYK